MHPLFVQTHARSRTLGKVIITEGEHGLLLKNGAFQRILGPGKYRIWPFTGVHILVVDTRRATLQMTNQKMLTSDNVAVTLSLVAQYEITDPRAAVLGVEDFNAQLYLDVQLAARNALVGMTLDQVLTDRGALGIELQKSVEPVALAYGVTVHSVGVKDVIFSPNLRNLLMKEVETRRLAQAALNSAREEAAATRSLLNTARLIEAHPALLRLRELEVARAAVQTGGNTLVIGLQSASATPIPVGGPSAPALRPDTLDDELEP